MLEFKLQMYFELYKDNPITNSSRFKDEFYKKYGKFDLINELVVMIQRYQFKKYGDLVPEGTLTISTLNKGIRNRREMNRNRNRFGTLIERKERKNEYNEKFKGSN